MGKRKRRGKRKKNLVTGKKMEGKMEYWQEKEKLERNRERERKRGITADSVRRGAQKEYIGIRLEDLPFCKPFLHFQILRLAQKDGIIILLMQTERKALLLQPLWLM